MTAAVYFLDLEGSGLHAEAHPTAVGLAIGDTGTDEVRARSWLIAPAPEWVHGGAEWDEVATELTGLDAETCRGRGTPVGVVAQALNASLSGGLAYVSARIDASWLDMLFDAADVERTFRIEHVSALAEAEPRDVGERYQGYEHSSAHDAARLAETYWRVVLGREPAIRRCGFTNNSRT